MSFLKLLWERPQSYCGSIHWPNQETVTTSILIVINIACQILGSSPCLTIGLNVPVRLFSGVQALSSGKPYKVAMDALGFGSLLFSHNRLVSIGVDVVSETINFLKKPAEKNDTNLTKEFKMIPPEHTDAHQPVSSPCDESGEREAKSSYGNLGESIKSTFSSCATGLWQQFQESSLGQRIFAPSEPALSPFFNPSSRYYVHSKRIDPLIHANACRILGIPEEKTKDLVFIKKSYEKEVGLLREKQSKLFGEWISVAQSWIDDADTAYQTLIQGID